MWEARQLVGKGVGEKSQSAKTSKKKSITSWRGCVGGEGGGRRREEGRRGEGRGGGRRGGRRERDATSLGEGYNELRCSHAFVPTIYLNHVKEAGERGGEEGNPPTGRDLIVLVLPRGQKFVVLRRRRRRTCSGRRDPVEGSGREP